MPVKDHVVHVYHDTEAMGRAVGAWLQLSLRRGGGAILACTPEHAALVREELRAIGIDVDACEREGRLFVGDAYDLLTRFMKSGRPDGPSFRALAGEILTQVQRASAPGPIRAWGEMVDVLVKNGNSRAAHELEKLWNDLLAEEDIQLLCSYEIDELGADAQARVLLDVCETHSDLVPEEGDALDHAVTAALTDIFGPQEAATMRDSLPLRKELLDVMQRPSAILLSLREMDAAVGAEVAQRARVYAQAAHAAEGK